MRIGLTLMFFLLGTVTYSQHFYQWHLNGVHPFEVELDGDTILKGVVYYTYDTFELEGVRKDHRLTLLEFEDDAWTATIYFDLDQNVGYWVRRDDSVKHLIFDKVQDLGYAFTADDGRFYTQSPVSRYDLHYVKILDDSLSTGYSLQRPDTAYHFTAVTDTFREDLLHWNVNYKQEMDYTFLFEAVCPRTEIEELNRYFDKGVDSLFNIWKTSSLGLRSRYGKFGFLYLELIAKSKHCWSFLQVSKINRELRVKSVHFNPKSKTFFSLRDEFSNWYAVKNQLDMGEIPIYHPAGIICVNPNTNGKKWRLLPMKEIKKYFKIFSPLRWGF